MSVRHQRALSLRPAASAEQNAATGPPTPVGPQSIPAAKLRLRSSEEEVDAKGPMSACRAVASGPQLWRRVGRSSPPNFAQAPRSFLRGVGSAGFSFDKWSRRARTLERHTMRNSRSDSERSAKASVAAK